MDDDKPIDEDGILWYGTREELEAWKAHKKAKAIRFVERGYSVAWTNDGNGYVEIYVPERHYAGTPELRASVKFYGDPSQNGIDGGRVSKLTIQIRTSRIIEKVLSRPSDLVETVYNYDRGMDFDHLTQHPDAKLLYDAIMEELN